MPPTCQESAGASLHVPHACGTQKWAEPEGLFIQYLCRMCGKRIKTPLSRVSVTFPYTYSTDLTYHFEQTVPGLSWLPQTAPKQQQQHIDGRRNHRESAWAHGRYPQPHTVPPPRATKDSRGSPHWECRPLPPVRACVRACVCHVQAQPSTALVMLTV